MIFDKSDYSITRGGDIILTKKTTFPVCTQIDYGKTMGMLEVVFNPLKGLELKLELQN